MSSKSVLRSVSYSTSFYRLHTPTEYVDLAVDPIGQYRMRPHEWAEFSKKSKFKAVSLQDATGVLNLLCQNSVGLHTDKAEEIRSRLELMLKNDFFIVLPNGKDPVPEDQPRAMPDVPLSQLGSRDKDRLFGAYANQAAQVYKWLGSGNEPRMRYYPVGLFTAFTITLEKSGIVISDQNVGRYSGPAITVRRQKIKK